MRSKLYAAAGTCLTVAAFTLPGLAGASPAVAATSPVTGSAAAPAAIGAAATSAAPNTVAPATLPSGAKEVCPKPSSLLQAQCQSFVLPHGVRHASSAAPADASETLTVADLQSAYGIDGTTGAAATRGSGETVAIVDAYGDPNIESDLATYRNANNLPACDVASGCLHVYNQTGGTTLPKPGAGDDLGWEDETALDVEMVSAICPNCGIDLYEATTANTPDLGTAVNTAAKKDKFVSNSWSSGDYPGESALDSYFNHPGVAIAAASGDYGYGSYGSEASYPGSSQFVISVGGTYLDGGGSSAWTQTVWNDVDGATGSGCSSGEGKPAWQTDSGCANRTQNDVSAVADSPNGIEVYSTDYSGWTALVGTSASTPIITAMYALAGTPEANTYPASYLYADPQGLTHVTSGSTVSNGTCESNRLYLCNAAHSLSNGYNGPTGLGTPNGNLTPFTAPTGNVVSLNNPGSQDLQTGQRLSLQVRGYDSAGAALTYTASGLPSGLSLTSGGLLSGSVSGPADATAKVTATDTTGAKATVAFGISAMYPLTQSYHAGAGRVTLALGGKCLDDNADSSANGTKVQIWQCISGDNGQNWSFLPDTDPSHADIGQVKINGKCLDVKSNGTANGTKIDLWSCSGGANQQWKMTGVAGELINPQSNKCLDDPGNKTANGTQLDIWGCNGGTNQDWTLPASQIDSAMYNRCLNDSGNSTANGAKVISYTCDGSAPERWVVAPDGTIRVNGKCLDDKSGNTLNGAAVDLWSCSSTNINEWWILGANGQIESGNAEKCLSIPNDNNANAVTLQDCTGKRGEVWTTS